MKKAVLVSFIFLFIVGSDAAARDYFIAPFGNDTAAGDEQNPLFNIQTAINLAVPGDRIYLAAGTYRQDFHSVRDGTASAPIRIIGKMNSVVSGKQSSHIVDINHSHIELIGFTLDGLKGDAGILDSYTDKLLYIKGINNKSGPKGIKVTRMQFRNAGGECLRMRYFVQHSEVSYSTFNQCGVHDFRFNAGGKNGEAIYLGTSSSQWQDGKNPTPDPDASHYNWIHHNVMNTQGNECVDIKEGASFNVVEYNFCNGQLDANSAGFDSRGDYNIFRHNRSLGNEGAGVRLGGHLVGGRQYGAYNYVYNNIIHHNQKGGVKFQVAQQGDVCENEFFANVGPDSAGTYKNDFNPGQDCPSSQTLGVIGVIASSEESSAGNIAQNTLDGDLSTRWSAKGPGEWIELELNQIKLLQRVRIAWHKGDQRVQKFQLQTSADRIHWSTLLDRQTSANTLDFETYDIDPLPAKYLRIVGRGNSQNDWTSITEIQIIGR